MMMMIMMVANCHDNGRWFCLNPTPCDGDDDDDGYVKNSPRSLLVDEGKALPTSGDSRGLGNCHDDDDCQLS